MFASRSTSRALEANDGIISENQNQVKSKIRKNRNCHGAADSAPGRPVESGPLKDPYFSGVRPPCALAALRVRAVALVRKRSIWPLGRVTQISPIHSSFTPLIGLALKLVRLTGGDDFPRSIVFS